MPIVILDTEYTTWPGALESGWRESWQHREIVQIAAIRVDDRFIETAALDVIVRPTINPQLSDLFVELTGIEQSRVDAEGVAFATALADLATFVGGDRVICMNGDCKVILDNCDINGVRYPFNGQFHRLRPLLERSGVDLTRRSSGDLHELTPSPLRGNTHNALHDVRSMAAWLAHASNTGILQHLDQMPTDLPTRDPRSLPADAEGIEAAARVLRAAGLERGWFRHDTSIDLEIVTKAMLVAAANPNG